MCAILVTYASRTGSTADIGMRIARRFQEEGREVYASPTDAVTSLEPYSGVIVGSAIRYGGWLPEAVRFIKTHQQSLKQRRVAVYSVCISLRDDTPATRRQIAAYLRGIRGVITPWAEGYFAGRLDPTRIGVEKSTMLRLNGAQFGDFIAWEKVEQWSEKLLAKGIS